MCNVHYLNLSIFIKFTSYDPLAATPCFGCGFDLVRPANRHKKVTQQRINEGVFSKVFPRSLHRLFPDSLHISSKANLGKKMKIIAHFTRYS